MPRKKLIRRFEPRYTVSQEMVDRESKYVHLEHADYLLASLHDLCDQLSNWEPLCRQVNETAESLIRRQGEREALAYRCMIARDLYHILELYCNCMRQDLPEDGGDATVNSTVPARQRAEEGNMTPMAVFNELLFGGES